MAERSQVALQVRIGAFILSGLLVFFAIIYLLGAQARYFERNAWAPPSSARGYSPS